jgi:hypothetical protein
MASPIMVPGAPGHAYRPKLGLPAFASQVWSSANEWGRRDHSEDWGRHGAHSLPNATQMQHETGKPLHIKGLLRLFDSAIPRFESWRPSQPVRSARCDFRLRQNSTNGFLRVGVGPTL